MNVQIRHELAIIGAWTLLCAILFPFFDSLALGLFIGLPLVLLFPGYVIIAALFPEQHQLGGLERVGLSLGTSIFLSPLVGVLYHFTPLGIQPYPILLTLAAIILVVAGLAWRQRRRLPEEERLVIAFNLNFLRWGRSSLFDKALSIVLAASIAAVVGVVGYSLAQPVTKEQFSELYILDLEGQTINYPKEVMVGEEVKVIVGIANQELQQENYRLDIRIEGKSNNEVYTPTLAQGEKWEQEVSFTPADRGENQRLEFLLFKDGETQPCTNPVYLWINAREVGEKFTVFHVNRFPYKPQAGAVHTADVEIVNHEGEEVTYQVEVWMAGEKVPRDNEAILEAGTTREISVPVIASRVGEQELEFRLYKKGETQPIRSVSFELTAEELVFYVADYPHQPEVGTIHTAEIVIVNPASETVEYRIEVWMAGDIVTGGGQATLEAEETKAITVPLTPKKLGEQNLEFKLYKGQGIQPLRTAIIKVIVGIPGFHVIDYPRRATLGVTNNANVEIINHEAEVVVYRIEVWIAREKIQDGVEATLEAGESKMVKIPITPQKLGDHNMEFRLYKSGEEEPISSISFIVSVK